MDRAKALQLTLAGTIDAAEQASAMPAQFELFQQLLSSDTDDYSVAHSVTGVSKNKKRGKLEAKVDADEGATGASSSAMLATVKYTSCAAGVASRTWRVACNVYFLPRQTQE